MEMRISPTQLKCWSECREKHRLSYLLNTESVEPSIHYQFGKVIHRMAEGYWAGLDYMTSFHNALNEAAELDIRLLNAKDQIKWSALQETIAAISRIYYEYHGDRAKETPAIINEEMVEWNWGSHAGIDVVCNGIIDRFSFAHALVDTKTASPIGADWKADLKKRLLREPQMGFYYYYLVNQCGYAVDGIEYEIIVKPFAGGPRSKPRDAGIETIDVTKEVKAFSPVFKQQMDWTIKEMCEFYAHCQDAAPWPMSNSMCTTSIWGECEFLPVCAGKTDVSDQTLYKIKQSKEEIGV